MTFSESTSSKSAKNQQPRTVENQEEYQEVIEQLMHFIEWSMPSSIEEPLEKTVQQMGVRAYGVVRATNGINLEVETQSSGQSVDWDALKGILLRRLRTSEKRSELIPLPETLQEKFGSRNLLVARLGVNQADPNWRRALVFAGREQPPVKDASKGFLTRDFPIIEKMADWYRKEEAGEKEIPARYQPLWRATSLRNNLTRYLGPRVRLTIGDEELVISDITPRKELGNLATQDMAEKCVRLMVGGKIADQVFLKPGVSLPTRQGTVDEFRIFVQDFPVYGRKISVRQLPRGTEAAVSLPMGWWWTVEPQERVISSKAAESIALKQEQSIQRDVADLEPYLVETVIWPDDPPGRIAYQVEVSSERGFSATYFINPHDSTLIAKRQPIRM